MSSQGKPRARPLTLALSGGGAKCAAQAGILAVLEEAHLPVGALVALSAGSTVAVLYGLGYTPREILDYFTRTSLLEVWEFDPTRRALFGAEKIRARLRQLVGDKTFAHLKIPVVALAVDLRTGREVRLTSGRLDQALMATMAIPGLFTPVEWEGMTLVDGGVLNPMPVDVAREIGPRVVALDVIHDFMLTEPTQIFESRGPMGYAAEVGRRLGLTDSVEAVYQAACLLTYRLAAYKLEVSPPDLLIRPAVRRVGLFAFDRAVEAYNLGEAAARAALPQLEALARPTFVSRVGDGWRSIFHDRRR